MVFVDNMANASWAETEALRRSIDWLKGINGQSVIMEGDCARVINRIINKDVDVTTLGNAVYNIKEHFKNFVSYCLKWCRGYVISLRISLAKLS